MPRLAAILPHSLWIGAAQQRNQSHMSDRAAIFETVSQQIEPFNKKGVALSETTTFQHDLEWDSLTVMDFVAAIEDEFDVMITMNMQAEIENVGQLVDAVEKLKAA
jgi:acyl carrier protein